MELISVLPFGAIVLATVASFVVQFIWYSPLGFAKACKKFSNSNQNCNCSIAYGISLSLIALFLQAVLLSFVLQALNSQGFDTALYVTSLLLIISGSANMLMGSLSNQKSNIFLAINVGGYTATVVTSAIVLALV